MEYISMIKIGICEDDEEQAKNIGGMTERCLFKRTEYAIRYFESGEEVIQEIESGSFDFDLLLLDIKMKKINGLETAEYIRRNVIDVDIIFITVSEKHVYEGYIYKAFSYILKPIDTPRFETELMRYMDERERTSNCLQISINGAIEKIQLDKVNYFESNARKITAYTNNNQIEFYNRLDVLEEMLNGKGFVRCHQSYLVNEWQIQSISRETLVVNGIKLPVSRKYYERMKAEGRFGK